MLACLLARTPLREFARGDIFACLAWAVVYQLIGVAAAARSSRAPGRGSRLRWGSRC